MDDQKNLKLLESAECFKNNQNHVVSARDQNQPRHLRVNKMEQIDKLKIVNPHVSPCCCRHHRLIRENCAEVVIELVEPESDSNCNQRDENVAIIPAKSLQGVNPLTREVIKSSVGHSVNSQGRVEVGKESKGNDEASAAVLGQENFPRRCWTWVCSKEVEYDCRLLHSPDTARVQLRKLKKF